MPKRNLKAKPKRSRVIFRLDAPNANQVVLMGDFNGWNPKKHAMIKNNDGIWEKTTMLLPGGYEYKFLVDGHWQTDPNSDHACINCYGTYNNYIQVSPKK